MDFSKLDSEKTGMLENPFAGRKKDGDYIEGYTDVAFLNKHFGDLEKADDMVNKTDDEGLKKFFQWLKDEGKLK